MIGAKINGKHTYRDYGLIITNGDIVGFPKPKINLLEVPGSSKIIDLTQNLTGKAVYESRTLKFNFAGQKSDWQSFMRDFLRDIHGQKLEIIFDDDKDFYYKGIGEVFEFNILQNTATFNLTVYADAFKYAVNPKLVDISVTDKKSYFIEGSNFDIVPIFYVSNISDPKNYHVTYKNINYQLKNGRNRFAEIRIPPGGETTHFTGTFDVQIETRGVSI